MLLIVDDYTKYQWCKFLKKKSKMASEAIEIIKKLMLENHEVKKIRWRKLDARKIMSKRGIQH